MAIIQGGLNDIEDSLFANISFPSERKILACKMLDRAAISLQIFY